MVEKPSNLALDDLVILQDLTLMQQVRGLDIGMRKNRLQSRNRLQNLFTTLQPILKPDLTLEIGAHSAPFSMLMAKQGFEAHAFEANPYNHQAFSPRINRRAPTVQYHHMAMSDADGEVTFQIKESRGGKAERKVTGNNSLLPRSDPAYSYETVTVPATRLDSFLAADGRSDKSFSAWIDVEGALSKVTAGFGTALQSCLSLIVEVEERSYWEGQMLVHDTMRYFAEQGLVPIARDFEYMHQYNLVYVRKDQLSVPGVRYALTRHLQGA